MLDSRNSYNVLWNKVIFKIINAYKIDTIGVKVIENAQDVIWDNYVLLRDHSKRTYMKDPEGLLDRHKVCACMIYSIVKSSVLKVAESQTSENEYLNIINEDLALTTGLSLLRAFIESAIRLKKPENSEQLLQKFKDGISFPPTNHGDYRENFLSELYFAKEENNYNILSLSHILYLLEVYTAYCN